MSQKKLLIIIDKFHSQLNYVYGKTIAKNAIQTWDSIQAFGVLFEVKIMCGVPINIHQNYPLKSF